MCSCRNERYLHQGSYPSPRVQPKLNPHPRPQEDQEFLIRNEALPASRIRAIETGGCPHAAIREDISANMHALEELQAVFETELLFVESGGDNLAGECRGFAGFRKGGWSGCGMWHSGRGGDVLATVEALRERGE